MHGLLSSVEEENTIENWLGEEVEPGRFVMSHIASTEHDEATPFSIPDEWLVNFPAGRDIFQFIIRLVPHSGWRQSHWRPNVMPLLPSEALSDKCLQDF